MTIYKENNEAHYHQWLFLEAWMSVKDPNAGNDHRVIPEVYKCLAHTKDSLKSRVYSTRIYTSIFKRFLNCAQHQAVF